MKPENLLLDESNNIKIVDFGLGNLYQEGQLLKTACGSPCYAAPEMIAGRKYRGVETDVWSCGIILFAMICGYLPFEDKNTSKLYEKIMKGDFSFPPFVSPDAKDLIGKLLTVDPKARIPICKIKSHSWFLNMKMKIVENEEILKNSNDCDDHKLNEEVLEKLKVKLNLNKESIEKALNDEKHNHITASYYLILRHMEKERKLQEFKEKIQRKGGKQMIHQKLNDFLKASSINNNKIFMVNLETTSKDKENIPKSFDLSFNDKNNMEYGSINNDQMNPLDIAKKFRIKSGIPTKKKLPENK